MIGRGLINRAVATFVAAGAAFEHLLQLQLDRADPGRDKGRAALGEFDQQRQQLRIKDLPFSEGVARELSKAQV